MNSYRKVRVNGGIVEMPERTAKFLEKEGKAEIINDVVDVVASKLAEQIIQPAAEPIELETIEFVRPERKRKKSAEESENETEPETV